MSYEGRTADRQRLGYHLTLDTMYLKAMLFELFPEAASPGTTLPKILGQRLDPEDHLAYLGALF